MRIVIFLFALLAIGPAVAQPAPLAAVPNDISARELHSIMNERDRGYNQRFDGQEKAVAAALAAAKEAVAKAEAANEKRFDSVNEFRGTLKDQQAVLMPRAEATVLLKAIEDKQRTTEERLAQLISRGEGVNWLIGMIGAAIGGMVGIAGAVAALWRRTVP